MLESLFKKRGEEKLFKLIVQEAFKQKIENSKKFSLLKIIKERNVLLCVILSIMLLSLNWKKYTIFYKRLLGRNNK